MKLRVEIERYEYEERQTLGELYVLNPISREIIFQCKTLELPWKDNQRRISCIPEGNYQAIKHRSPKFGDTFWIQNVPNRSEILIHAGNYYRDTLGCILPGEEFKDVNKDGIRDVTNSKKTMQKLLELLPERVNIAIINCS